MFIDLARSVAPDDEAAPTETLTSVMNADAWGDAPEHHVIGFPLSESRELAARASVCKIARWGIAHEPQIHYTQSYRRGDWLHQAPYTLPLSTDCSGFVSLCYRWAGLPDPSGVGWTYVGNSAAITAHCHAIHPKQAKPGDLIAYGPNGEDHIVVITGALRDGSVVVCSHGWEGGPVRTLQIREQRSHRAPATWLRNPCFAPPRP